MTHDSLYTIVYLISNFFTLFIIHKYYCLLLPPCNKPLWLIAGLYALYFGFNSVLHLIISLPVVMLIGNICFFFLISLLFPASLSKRIIASLSSFAIMFIIEMIITAVFGVIHFNFDEKVNYFPAYSQVILRLGYFGGVIVMSGFKNIKKQKTPSVIQLLSFLVVIGSSLYLVTLLFSISGIPKWNLIFAVFSIFLTTTLFFSLYDLLANMYLQSLKNKIYEKESMYYQHECELMQAMQEETAALRHDMKNHLSVIAQLSGTNDSSVSEYITSLAEKLKTNHVYSNSGNMPIDSIINYKFRNAEDDGIQIQSAIAVPPYLKIDTVDIVTILGNLLDNALQALENVSHDRKVNLKMMHSKGRLFISMQNNFDGNVKYQNGVITTSKKNGNHGYGLKNIKKTVEKYHGSVKIQYDNSNFMIDIILFIPE